MRILRLTNSNDTNPGIPEHLRSTAVAEQVVSERLGVPVDSVARVVRPDPGLPEIVESWLTRYQPDAVFVRVSSYWVTFESVPLRIERRGGPFLRWTAALGARIGSNRRAASTAPYRLARRLIVRLVGGDVYLTPAEAAENAEAVLRKILAHESVVVVVRGPMRPLESSGTAAGRRRAAKRLDELDALLRDSCARLNVEYLSGIALGNAAATGGDEIHETIEGHRIIGRAEGAAIADAWLASRT